MTTRIATRLLSGSAALLCAAAASAQGSQNYADATNDLFDNGFTNLDITNVNVSNTATELNISVTTQGYANWTKFLIFLDVRPGGVLSNPWGRSIDIDVQHDYEHFIGSWIEEISYNSQFWSYGTGTSLDAQWNLDSTFSNSISGNTVTWSIPLAWLGLGMGSTFYFDVATTGGSTNDPGVDHLSRMDPATPGWGTASTSGAFLSYTVVPAPGALALVAAAGLLGASRRRR